MALVHRHPLWGHTFLAALQGFAEHLKMQMRVLTSVAAERAVRECSSHGAGVLPYCGGHTFLAALHGFAEYLELQMQLFTSVEQRRGQ